MIVLIFSLILSVVCTLITVIHLYWFFGGNWGLQHVIPTKNALEDFRPPPKFATLLVALGMFLIGLMYLVKAEIILFEIPNWISKYGYWLIPSIFIIRAIGEFKYVGFFKKIQQTVFAEADTKWFTPLSLCIGCLGLVIQLLSN